MKIMPYISLSYFMGAWALPRCRACCHPDPPVARHFGSGVRRHLHGACGGAGTNCRHVAWGQKGHVGGGCKPYETWSIAMNKSTIPSLFHNLFPYILDTPAWNQPFPWYTPLFSLFIHIIHDIPNIPMVPISYCWFIIYIYIYNH